MDSAWTLQCRDLAEQCACHDCMFGCCSAAYVSTFMTCSTQSADNPGVVHRSLQGAAERSYLTRSALHSVQHHVWPSATQPSRCWCPATPPLRPGTAHGAGVCSATISSRWCKDTSAATCSWCHAGGATLVVQQTATGETHMQSCAGPGTPLQAGRCSL